jgi:hypothetical protein
VPFFIRYSFQSGKIFFSPKTTDLRDVIAYPLSLRCSRSLNDVLSKTVIKNRYSNLRRSEGPFGCCNTGSLAFVTFLFRSRLYYESKQPSAGPVTGIILRSNIHKATLVSMIGSHIKEKTPNLGYKDQSVNAV